jgi:hypothetical protein
MREVLILGGYGNFGKRIAYALARAGVPIIIAGRNEQKANQLVTELRGIFPSSPINAKVIDADNNLSAALKQMIPTVVVNSCGPFQQKNYTVAEACIAAGVHYIDLADGREFVTGITALDAKAKAANLCVISGASTVPGLSSAVLEHYKHEFTLIESMVYGISPGQKAERGLATTQGILTYIGKPLKPVVGDTTPRYGWQDIYQQEYPILGLRWMANCDIPDLDIFPTHYGIEHIRFSAGMENTILHLAIWLTGWLVRIGIPLPLNPYAEFLLKASHWFDRFGTADGGMHVILAGQGKNGQRHERRWFIVARNGDGPQIPCVPAILLARKFASGDVVPSGARPCVGLISLEDYVAELSPFQIQTYSS